MMKSASTRSSEAKSTASLTTTTKRAQEPVLLNATPAAHGGSAPAFRRSQPRRRRRDPLRHQQRHRHLLCHQLRNPLRHQLRHPPPPQLRSQRRVKRTPRSYVLVSTATRKLVNRLKFPSAPGIKRRISANGTPVTRSTAR